MEREIGRDGGEREREVVVVVASTPDAFSTQKIQMD